MVLAHLLVVGRDEADDRVTTRMADIDSDKHSSLFGHLVRELEVEKVSPNLTVDLLENIGRLGQIEFVTVPGSHNL